MHISKQFQLLHADVAGCIQQARDSMICALACFVFKAPVRKKEPRSPRHVAGYRRYSQGRLVGEKI
jgi:hypothetical protein